MNRPERTLLIIDDSPADRELYRRYLSDDRDRSYAILEAELGEQGLELWDRHQPDAVLLDLRLPDMDGLAFIDRLSRETPDACLPIVMVTGQGNEEIAVRAIKAGAQNYLVKGQLTPESLQLAIEGAIEAIRLRLQLQQRIDRERLVSRIIQKIHQTLELEEILQTAVTEVRQFLQTDRVLVFRLEADGNGTVVAESVGAGWNSVLATTLYDPCLAANRLGVDGGKFFSHDPALTEGELARYRQGWVTAIGDLRHSGIEPCHQQLLERFQVQANLVVPILGNDRCWGLLIAHHCKAPRSWLPSEIDLLKELAPALSIALRQGELYQQAQRELAERQQTGAELRESEERYAALAEIAPVGIFRTDAEGNCLYANPRWCELAGLSLEEALGKGWVKALHPDDRDRVIAEWEAAAASHCPFAAEYRFQTPSGVVSWLVGQATAEKDGEGNAIGYVGTVVDITERQQTEETLRQSEEFKNRLLESSPDCIKVLDPQGRLLYMNAGGMCVMEIDDFAPYLHAEWLCFWQDEYRQAAQQALEEAKAGKVSIFQGFCPTAKGTPKWWEVIVSPMLDASGQIEQVLSVSRDITDRQQAEEAIRTSEEHFRTLADNMSQFAWMADETGWLFWYNQRWFDYTGTTLEEMQGWGWQKIHHPDHIDRVVRHFRHCLETGTVWEDTFPLRGRDGQYRWFLSRAIPIADENGRIVRWFGTNTDIDDRKRVEEALTQSEERYRCLAELIPQLVWTADETGALLDVNQRWTDFTGITLEEARERGWERVVHPEDIPAMARQWTEAVSRGTSYQAEGRMQRADGVYRWHLHQAIPQKDAEGRIVKWFGTATDIDAQKQLEVERDRLLEQEQAARAEAERANRVKDEFLAILSHELRSPLNPILGWAQLLQTRTFDRDRTLEGLATIERNAKLQTQLIDDLLDVAKILRGKLGMKTAPVDLVFAISSAMETVKAAASAKSIALHSDLPRIGRVLGDAARLQQVVWNLLSNAIKFTPKNGRVDIRLQRVSDEAQIAVSDTGKGINPDFLPHIFESFRQEDTSTTRKYGGLGLGLAIVRSLVEAHGGTISAESPGEGRGATFTVRLPLLDTERATQSARSPVPDLDLTGIRVLAVDDEPDARELLTILLTQYGAEALVVTSAAEAIAALESFQPDVLVSDIGMPDVDGYTSIQRIRALPPAKGGQIPAIALTAYTRDEDRHRALSSGYQQHVTKPLEPDRLVRAIINALRQNPY